MKPSNSRQMKKVLLILLLFWSFEVYSQNISDQIQQVKHQISLTKSEALRTQFLIKLGSLYQQADSTSKAIEVYNKALEYLSKTNNVTALYEINSFLGVLYSEKGDYQNAQKSFAQAVKYARIMGKNRELSQALFNLANVQMSMKDCQNAIKNFEEALSISFNLNNLELVKKAYANIAICYKQLGNDERSQHYFKLSVAIDKKIKDETIRKKQAELVKQQQIARQQKLELNIQKFQNKILNDSLRLTKEINEKIQMQLALKEKDNKIKDLEIQRKNAELARKNAEIRSKTIVIISLAILLIVIFIAVVAVYRLYKEKKYAYEQVAALNEELKKKNKELEEKNQLIEEQKQELEHKNRQIKESIQYASRIQRAILPTKAAIAANFPAGNFIFYLPRDIVSGDFYWFSKHGDYMFLALVDCTGHSVPGAFMSLIGNTLLNEIINSKHIFDPAQALLTLHHELVKLLHQKVPGKETIYDGMDIALCRFDHSNDKLTFASANQPVFIFYPDGSTKIFDGDIYSIGGFSERIQVKFKNVTVDLENYTNLYLSSDGYFDQFNGKTGKKFTRKRFVDLLKKIYRKPMSEQHKIIYDTFEEWKGDFKQIDDVLVMGVRYTDKETTEDLRNKELDVSDSGDDSKSKVK